MRIACFALSSLLTGCCFAPPAPPVAPAPVVPAPVIPVAVLPSQPMPPPRASGAFVDVQLVPQGEEGLSAVHVLVTNTDAVDVVNVGVLADCTRAAPGSFSLAAVRCGDGAGDYIDVRETDQAVVVTRQAFDHGSREVFPVTEVGRISLGRAHIVRE
jgi:hypothetical protein